MRKMLQIQFISRQRVLLTLLLGILLAPLGFGQTTVTIGTGTSAGYGPVNSFNTYSVTEMVYLSSEIGAGSESVISKIAFQRNDASSGGINIAGVKIYLKSSATATLATGTYSTSGYTLVYNGAYSVSTANGWKEITLTTPFTYNGTDNLHVLIEKNAAYALPYVKWNYSSTSTNFRTRYTWQDSPGMPTSLTTSYNRPNIQLTYTAATPMLYTSSTTTQSNTSGVKAGSTSQVVVGVEVVTTGATSPLSITSFNFTTSGTTSTGDISNAKVFSTGGSSTFATGTQFGSTVASPNGAFSVTGSQALVSGTNYFWLTYDIAGGATDGNLIDATCEQITVSGTDYTPTVTSPVGSRTIRQPLTGTKTIAASGGNYTTLGAAINDLNNIGVGTGGVTFTLADGETFNETPTIRITQSGSEANPIIIKQSGSGTKPILSFAGTASVDTCIKLNQASYVTLDGLQIVDAMATNKVEYGLYFYGNLTVGSQYNTVKNCVIDLDKTNTSTTGVYFYNSASSAAGTNSNNKFYNNTVQDCYSAYNFNGNSSYYDTRNEVNTLSGGTSTVTNIGGSSSSVYAVQVAYQVNFVFSNTTISNVSGTSSVYGVYQGLGSSNSVTYSSNILNNISGTLSTYGMYISSGNTAIVEKNEVDAVSATGASVYGIYSSGTTNTVRRNKIHNVNYSGSGSFIAYGLSLAGGTTAYIYNNMLYDIKATASTGTPGVRAMNLSGGTNAYVYYNSVMIDYVSTSASNQSAALYVTTSPTTLEMSNNIFVNRSNATTGTRAVAFYKSTSSLTNLSANNNNNLFYAGTPGAKNLIFYDGTNSDQNLAAFKTRMGTKESASVSENPDFLSATDLHINTSTPTQIESGGKRITSPIAVTDDHDANIRQGEAGYAGLGTAPDIGADEGNFTLMDINPPSISYALLTNSSGTSTRTLANVTITDPSGVDVTPGTAPRVYYKKSTDNNEFAGNTDADNGWKWVESGSGSSPFSFDIDYSIINGGSVGANDVIQYFVVAQDMAGVPNVGINSGTPNGTPGSVDLQSENAPITGTINSYTIIGSISGIKTVGSGGDYASITAAITAISGADITGPVTLSLIDVTYTESVSIPVLTGSSAVNTLTIKPASGNTVTWTSSSTTSGTLRLNGADYVIIDGSNNGTTSRDMTISNTATATFSTPVWISSLGTGVGSTNITIKNCNLKAGSTSLTTSYGVFVAGQTLSGTGTGDDNDNVTIQNNVITKAYTGIYARASSSGVNNGLTISGNTIGSSAQSDYLGKFGLDLTNASGSSVSGNTVFSLVGTITNPTGMLIGSGFVSSSINANKIYQLSYTGTGGYGAKGIDLNTGSATSALTVSNNLIYNLTGDGFSGLSGDAIVGIRILGATGGLNIWYNSVNLYGNISRSGATADKSAALYIVGTATNLDIRNNIFANSIENTTGVATAYAIYSDAANTAFAQINNNIYYATGPEGVLGYLGANKTTIAEWQSATGKDANSLSSDPTFRANDNLQPFTGSPALSAATPVSVTTDYTGSARSGSTPSIGAYETGFVPPGVDWANLQWPGTMTLKEGRSGNVYAQVYEPGVTEPAGQGTGIQVWIGYNSTNTDPKNWTKWVAATFNAQQGNNDEYVATIGDSLPAGTYYYASRILLTGGAYQYGGFNGGFWDGTTNISGVLTVEDGLISWANLQFPATASITEGGSATVYGRVYAADITNIAGRSGIKVQVGISSTDNNPSGWLTWTDATFNSKSGNNEEFTANIGTGLTTGTYYYAFRYKLANDDYVYGGYSTDGGGFWNGTTYVSGVLTVNPFTTDLPYSQNFDGVTGPALPLGWTVTDNNSDSKKWTNTASNPRSTPNAMKIVFNSSAAMDDWFFSPGINLQAGVEYEVTFYYRAENTTFPEKLEVKWGSAANVAGMTGGTFFTNSAITNTTYSKGSGSFTPSSSGVYYIGWHGFSNMDEWNLYVDDIVIRVQPAASSSQSILAGNTDLTTFTGTGAQVQFTVGNTGAVTIEFDKIIADPRGAPPVGIVNVAKSYWTGTVVSGMANGTYTITLDLTGIPGITDPSTLHLLKRSNSSSAWVDMGTPSDVSAFPFVSWAGLTSFSDFGIGGLADNPLPVELVNFNAKARNRNALLSWETKTEVDNSGFEVERMDKDGNWKKVTFVEGHGTSNSTKYYSFEDQKLSSGKHSYRLKQIDNDGTTSYSEVVEVTIDLPKEFAMSQNYPNPFNPSTKVDYQLAADSKVRIELYSITGERVAVLMDQEQEAGYYSMMIDSYTHRMASGIYIYRMIATDAAGKNFVATKKLALLK